MGPDDGMALLAKGSGGCCMTLCPNLSTFEHASDATRIACELDAVLKCS
jgi:hypothetical protein